MTMLKDTEAATQLGLKAITLRLWRMQKKGPVFCRLGRSIRYSEENLTKFVEENTIRPGARDDNQAGL